MKVVLICEAHPTLIALFRTRLSHWLRVLVDAGVAAVIVVATGMSVSAHAQQGSLRVPSVLVEYTPFEVVLQTGTDYCAHPTFPLLGEVQYQSKINTLAVAAGGHSGKLRQGTPFHGVRLATWAADDHG